jgi:hypothetical protein
MDTAERSSGAHDNALAHTALLFDSPRDAPLEMRRIPRRWKIFVPARAFPSSQKLQPDGV